MLPRALALAARAATWLPPAADRRLAAAVGPAWCALDPARRRAVALNRSALGVPFRLSAPFSAYTVSLFTWLRLLGSDSPWVRARTTFEGLEGPGGLREAAGRGGVVLLAAHVGSWEWGAAALAAAGLPVVAVAATQMNDAWSPALAQAKVLLGVQVVGPHDGPWPLTRALRRGGVVALLVDGDVASAVRPARMGSLVALLPRGPALLAARTGASLWAGRCEPAAAGGGRHDVRLSSLAPGRAVGTATLEDREAVLHARVGAWLDATVRESPGAWCLFRPFFAGPMAAVATGAAA